jgi:hypothetical protein
MLIKKKTSVLRCHLRNQYGNTALRYSVLCTVHRTTIVPAEAKAH